MIEIKGDESTINSLLGLLGSAAAFELAVEHGRLIKAKVLQRGPRSSASLWERLTEMIAAKVKVARVDVSAGPSIGFGVFADRQRLCVVNALSAERGVPGIGTVIAIHEIWENYASRNNDGSQAMVPRTPQLSRSSALWRSSSSASPAAVWPP